jgi:hypothetical protein
LRTRIFGCGVRALAGFVMTHKIKTKITHLNIEQAFALA